MKRIYGNINNMKFEIHEDGLISTGIYNLCGTVSYWTAQDLQNTIKIVAKNYHDATPELRNLLDNGISLEDAENLLQYI